MPATAAAQYWAQRQRYRSALDTIATIADDDIKHSLRKALTAHVRGKFRGLSRALTTRMECRLSCLPDNWKEPIQVEHAVPLNLIHNRLLGIQRNGDIDHDTYNLLPTIQDIEAYVRAFVVGVLVTPGQHALLNAWAMNGEWAWLADSLRWDWSDLDLEEWNYDNRPVWLQSVMNRYEHVPIPYRPLSDFERKWLLKRRG